MKKLLVLFTLLITQLTFGQSLDNATKNKIKAKYYGAEASYNQSNYKDALEKIYEIEILGNGIILPTAQNLKVKVLIGLKEFSKAKNELNKLQNLNLSEDIIKDIASYSDKINKYFKAIKEKQATLLKNARKFKNGVAITHYNKKYGLINQAGEVILPIEYDEIEDFSEGLSLVKNHHDVPGKLYWHYSYGYVDYQGNFIIPFKNYNGGDAESFSEGLAKVSKPDGKIGFINKQGKLVINYQFDFSDKYFKNGKIKVTNWEGGSYYINKQGQRINNTTASQSQNSYSSNSSNALNMRKVYFKNDCRYKVKLAIRYRYDDDNWETLSWYNFDPNEGNFLNNANRQILMTNNSIVYYYAEIPGENYSWTGKNERMVDGVSYKMRKTTMDIDASGSYYISIDCSNKK